MKYFKLSLIVSICLLPFITIGQLTSIDHWETVVLENDTWSYYTNSSTAPDANWNQPTYSPSSWLTGQGGIGYADGDDNTIIAPTLALYMRLDFNIIDTAQILAAILHADYDDAFVAYLNGNEIARANIGTTGVMPSHTETAATFREAMMYQGGNPDGFLLSKNKLEQYLKPGNNTLAIQVHNYTPTSSDMSARFFLSVGMNSTGISYNSVPSWFVTPFVASNLPIIKINTNGQTIPEETKITADMEVIHNGVGNLNYLDDIPNHYDDKIGIELRGASSLMFDKKGFGLETRDSLGDNNNVELLGMPSENDWTLHGPYSDKTLLRNVVTYHIGGQLGRYNPRVRLCEVFLDDQYWGVYVLKEKIKRDNNRVDISKLSPADTLGDELTGGYIFKIDRDMGTENGWFSTNGYGYYAYHHPGPDDLHQKQKDYLKNHFDSFEAMMATSSFDDTLTGYPAWLDVPSFIDYMMIQEITRNIDAYRLSAFMYKEKDSNGGKIHAGPIWDFNLGYGNEDFCDAGSPYGWAFNLRHVCGAPFPFFWSQLVSHAEFRNEFNCRWNELRSTVLHTDTIHHYIDSMVLLTTDARIRNFDKWDNVIGQHVWPNTYVGATYQDEINFLKTWISDRLNWMDTNMIGTSANCITGTGKQVLKENIKVYPNPFDQYLSFETDANEPITIQLYDNLGRIVQVVDLSNAASFHQMETSHLPNGVYFYAVYKDNQLIDTGKVLK